MAMIVTQVRWPATTHNREEKMSDVKKSDAEATRELTPDELDIVAGGQLGQVLFGQIQRGVQAGASDIVAGAQAIQGGHINTGLGLIAEGVMDVDASIHFGPGPH
jgi:hypothetical protein